MSRSRAKAIALAAAAMSLFGCGLIDLAGLGVSVHPAGQGSVLSAGDLIWVEFSEPVEALSAERTLSFSSQRGAVEVDYRWDGPRLLASPRAELERGVRYTISAKGRVRKANGNYVDVDEESSFYYATNEPFPTLLSAAPSAGAIVAVDAAVEFRFSAAMDRDSAEEAFALSPSADCDFSWPSDDVMVATPKEALEALTYYTWKLANSAQTLTEVRFWSQQSGTFYTAADYDRPTVTAVSRASWDEFAGTYAATLPGVADGLTRGEVLLVEFSEPVDTAQAAQSIRVEPGFRGSVIALSSSSVAFVPAATNQYDAPYTIVVPKEIPDLAGIPMGVDYRLAFSAADMALGVATANFQTDGLHVITVTGANMSTSVPVTLDEFEPAFDFFATITFTRPFANGASKAKAIDSILLEPFFPTGAPSPTLFSVTWGADDTVTLHYQGVEGPVSVGSYFYKLIVPKGIKTDISGEFYFDTIEDAWVYVEMRGN